MQLQEYQDSPTKKRHPAYDNSLFAVTAPEWSTGEVLLGSAYRRLILDTLESQVNLDDIPRVATSIPGSFGDQQVWTELLLGKGGIKSPFRRGQSSSHLSRQLMPVVPSVARIANVQGRPRSRWVPSNLLLETVGAGLGPGDGAVLARELGKALAVDESDDIFAQFIERAMQEGLRSLQLTSGSQPPYLNVSIRDADVRAYRASPSAKRLTPAERFSRDLGPVLTLKDQLTRRQWTSLVEALMRVGLGMHVLWTCHANWIAWQWIIAVASGQPSPTEIEIERELWESHGDSRPLLEIGEKAKPLLESVIERYAYARIGINTTFCRLDDAGSAWPSGNPIGFASTSPRGACAWIKELLGHVSRNRAGIDASNAGAWLQSQVSTMFDKQADLRSLAKCDSGFTKNLYEFARHSLGQIESGEADLRSYDQSYLVAYPGPRRPLVVQPGPAMLITLVHACCQSHPNVPVGLEDFRQHLADYGLRAPAGELVTGKTGSDLGKLGLIVDSPDAAGGRLLVPPF